MNNADQPAKSAAPQTDAERIDIWADEFERAVKNGQTPRIEDYLEQAPDELRSRLFSELIKLELEILQASNRPPDSGQYRERFPEYSDVIDGTWQRPARRVRDDASTSDSSREHDTSLEGTRDWESLPERIGKKFVVERRLGKGGFAVVYLARDEDLDRRVAVKVPRPDRFRGEEDIERFLQEARHAARLDHPGIVPVHEVNREADSVYIVQKYIDGTDLAGYAADHALTLREIVELLIQAAEALRPAHEIKLYHRDLKPSNILVDTAGRPYVADFGLAVHASRQRSHRGEVAGSIPYMAPEQVRGEAHILDGRADIWALGVILYELLTGTRPFEGRNSEELFEEIKGRDPAPPIQINRNVPIGLSRICLACLAKRAVDRYQSTTDLVDDLRHWLSKDAGRGPSAAEPDQVTSEVEPRIVPKGLRSFDAGDADFFLELLPGPRDREGLPKSIRFWKALIEATQVEETFRVGLLYGPSGCGKSSLVKAGLLPRLDTHVIPVYVEATAADTEVRVVKGLRQSCRDLSGTASLVDIMSSLRERRAGGGKKVVIVLDQFEQWLHAHDAESGKQLVDALRQCDGRHVQCLLLVRDDFWMSITRFMDALEVPLLQGENFAAVDLFDVDHAKKVLAAFGRAYGKLPDSGLIEEQTAFLDEAAAGLAEDGKIISVRLAVFAQMMQGRAWTAESLHEVGGTKGVGVTFLEETFSARTAPPQYRVHEEGVRSVLKALLPESGTGIKGQMQSREQLMEAAEYGERPSEFDTLLGILDREVRLITPTEPDATGRARPLPSRDAADDDDARDKDATGRSTTSHQPPTTTFYQLTHDYLVPSLREWLNRKQTETRRGRAELRLADLAAAWNRQPENRHLPSLFEYANIRHLTRKDRWSDAERLLMGRAGKVWATRLGWASATAVLLLIAAFFIAGQVREQQNATRARGLVEALLAADVNEVPQIIEDLGPYRPWAVPLLQELVTRQPQDNAERRQHLHARAALAVEDESQVEPLLEELLRPTLSDARYVGIVTAALTPYRERLLPDLWQNLHDAVAPDTERFRAGLALAGYAPESENWTEGDDGFLVEHLVSSDAEYQPFYRDYLRPRHEHLLPHLLTVFNDGEAAESLAATKGIADYAGDQAELIGELIMGATTDQYTILYPLLEIANENIQQEWLDLARLEPPADLAPLERVTLGQRRAGAAITLLRQGEREAIFDIFRVTDDPESLTQFVHRCRDRGVTPVELLECLDRADAARNMVSGEERKMEDRVMFGLLLALGEFQPGEMPADRQDSLVTQIHEWHATDPSSGIHGATGWLLRHWGREDLAREVDQTPVPYEPGREWYTMEVKVVSRELLVELEESIYFTFIVFPPGEYLMGSPDDEPNHESDEQLRRVTLTRPLAVSDREVTWQQFNVMGTFHHGAWERQFSRQLGSQDPAFGVNWFESVAYCRWLTAQTGLPESEQCYADPEDLERDAEGNPTDWPLDLDGRGFRMLTEAEWEYACRSGTGSAFSFGNDFDLLEHYGWNRDNSGEWSHAVGRKRPNYRGLLDLHGNLAEWCHDWYGGDMLDGTVDPVGPDEGSLRLFRGGIWAVAPRDCRSARRYRDQPEARIIGLGFRLALSPSAQAGEQEQAAEP